MNDRGTGGAVPGERPGRCASSCEADRGVVGSGGARRHGTRRTRRVCRRSCHPRMMLALLVYGYANGIFGSRRIERATYRDIGVRYVAANCHPDHDTICTFRRSNFDAVAEAFLQVLLLAKELQLLRVGTVSVDGTKVDANVNKRNSLRYDRAGALREQLRGEIEGLLDQAEHADTDDAPDPQGLPEELSRRDKLRVKLDRACAELERRAQARADSERAEYERKVVRRGSGVRDRARVGTSSRRRKRRRRRSRST